MSVPASAMAQGSGADLTGGWIGSAGTRVAIVQQGPGIRVCTVRSTTGRFIKVYSGTVPTDGVAPLRSVPQSVDDIGADLPPEIREQLIRDFHYSFRIDLRELPRDRVQISWYVDSVTWTRLSRKVESVTPSTTPTPEDFSRVRSATPGFWRRGLEGIIIHFGRVLRNDSRWRDWYRRTAGARGLGELGPNIRRFAKIRTREELTSLGKALSQLADRSRVGQLAQKARGQLVESAARTSSSWNQAAGISKVGGTALLGLGLLMSAYNIITAPEGEGLRVGFGEAGNWAGSLIGGELGAKGGAAIGTLLFPGLGTVVGAILGGLAGGFLGGAAGGLLMERLHDSLFGRVMSVAALLERCASSP